MSRYRLSSNVPVISQFSAADRDLFETLYRRLIRVRKRNLVRRRYYEYRASLKDLGISIPPTLREIDTVIGWPAKAVDAMNRRIRFDGFTRSDAGSVADLGIEEIDAANGMAALIPQVHLQSLLHATAFAFVTMGDVAAGEPEVLFTAASAEWATGMWDPRRRQLSSALVITDKDKNDAMTGFVMHTPGRAIIGRRVGQRWDLRVSIHDLGMPAEQLPYSPTLDRPFGRSRITRPMMSLTDSGVRTMVRTEVSAEFYNAPRAAMLGADTDAFTDKDGKPLTGWQVLMGQMLTMSRDEDGNLPQIHEFSQQSMEPNLAQLRMLAQQFSAESMLPLRSLGIVGDNPESEGAISEANRELELEVEAWESHQLGPAWKRLYIKGLRILDDTPAANELYATLMPRWRDQEAATANARADMFSKNAAAVPELPQTEVGLELMGLTPDQITRFQAELRTQRGQTTLAEIAKRSTAASLGAK